MEIYEFIKQINILALLAFSVLIPNNINAEAKSSDICVNPSTGSIKVRTSCNDNEKKLSVQLMNELVSPKRNKKVAFDNSGGPKKPLITFLDDSLVLRGVP